MKQPKKIAGPSMQVDRWPLTESTNGPYLVSIICVAHFQGKPDVSVIKELLLDATIMLDTGEYQIAP